MTVSPINETFNDVSLESGILLIRETGELGIGEVARFRVIVDLEQLSGSGIELEQNSLHVEFKNCENALLRPVWITGPYSLYIDIVPHNYDERVPFKDERLQFVADLKPDETFKAKLLLNANSQVRDSSKYAWCIDIIAQFTVVTIATLPFIFAVATTHKKAKVSIKHKHSEVKARRGVEVKMLTTEQLWNQAPPFPQKPVHLVIITHGIFSSIGGDMLCLKDSIERAANNVGENQCGNVIVRGFNENIGKSNKGVRYLGFRLAKYIIDTVDKLRTQYDMRKISFVGHSLGGLVQAMAVHYISVERPDIFDPKTGLEPVCFITAASPFLGVIGDMPKYVSLALDVGALGSTGRDLTLKRSYSLHSKGLVKSDDPHERIKAKPILEILPKSPALEVFQRFKHRTVYANVAFDGIVPLRTAALLYLDWRALSEVQQVRGQNDIEGTKHSQRDGNKEDMTGEIPESSMDKTSILQWLLPQTLIKREKYKPYIRTQVTGTFQSSESEGSSSPSDVPDFKPPKKANTLRAAASTLTAPLPSNAYLTDPSSRTDRILHDRIYTPDELPSIHYKHKKLVKKIIYPNYSIHAKEERIARNWQESMDWRKVLVELQPDSHNNIIVRRRFVNSFGWVVINHLADEHFGMKSTSKS